MESRARLGDVEISLEVLDYSDLRGLRPIGHMGDFFDEMGIVSVEFAVHMERKSTLVPQCCIGFVDSHDLVLIFGM